MIKELEFGSSQQAWEGINEYFLLEEEDVVKFGGTRSAGLIVMYDMMVKIRKLWVDPQFDYGKMFNYRMQKWTSLVNNYVDMNYLDLVKAEVIAREKKKDKSYNVSYLFDNMHAHGKGCLLSITFCRRPSMDNPLVVVSIRSSEVVKRLNFDFLLVQRICEYVYGITIPVTAQFYFPNAYTSATTSAMYHKHKSLHKLFHKVIKAGEMKIFQARVLEDLEKYSTMDQAKINYKVNLRVARALQTENIPPLLAKDLTLVRKS